MNENKEIKDISGEISRDNLDDKIKEIANSLMNSILDCVDKDGKPIEIEPLWIEAYLYQEGLYTPEKEHGNGSKAACHCNEYQQNHFGMFYFHIADKGEAMTRYGIDICFSVDEELYFSFLIKRAKVKREGQWRSYKEMALERDVLSTAHRRVGFKAKEESVTLKQCERIHLNPKTVCEEEVKKKWAFYNGEYCNPSKPRDGDGTLETLFYGKSIISVM